MIFLLTKTNARLKTAYNMKCCFKCNIIKKLDDFYTHPQMEDGHLNKCKECTKKDVIERYYSQSGRLHVIRYERLRAQTKHRKKKASEYQRKRRLLNPEKEFARRSARKLLKEPCVVCGNLKVEAHHPDYSQPLSVMWLCRKHHMIEEGKIPF